MNFGQAIQSGFSNYVNFSGRAIRSEYRFWTMLFVPLGAIAATCVDGVVGLPVTTSVLGLATLPPSVAVTIRRLHDLYRSGWWLLIGFVPLLGAVHLLVWFCTRGTTGYNVFGPDYFRPGGYVSRRSAA
jgi:uncharacterized membrane protein YhaH (DUF805 family)